MLHYRYKNYVVLFSIFLFLHYKFQQVKPTNSVVAETAVALTLNFKPVEKNSSLKNRICHFCFILLH